MKSFLAVFTVLVGSCAAQYFITPYSNFVPAHPWDSPFVNTIPVSTQYHAQDELGQFVFGHSSPGQAREETKTFDGTVRGSYSYVDPTGKVNQVVYKAGADGFQILGANNLPVAPEARLEPVKDTPEVVLARADFAKKFEEAKVAALKTPEDNPVILSDFGSPLIVKSALPTPISSASLLGRTTIKTSELKPIEDRKVPASTKLAEIKETEKEIFTTLPRTSPITITLS